MKRTDLRDISVILPVYNGASTLEACVQSVLAAGERVAEIIIVDDGSTDGTADKADSLADKVTRIRVIHTENHGSYTARLTGIRAAAYPCIAFIDVDDRFLSGALDVLAGLMEKYGADTAFGGYLETETPETWKCTAPQPREEEISVRTPEEMWPRIMKWKTQEFACYLWNKVYRRELFSNLLEAEGLCQGDDVLLTCQYFLKARRIVETTMPVYLYVQSPESLTRTGFGDHDLDLISVWDRIVRLMRGKGRKLYYMACFNRWRTDFTLICRLILADSQELDRRYAGDLEKWREGLRKHWRRLTGANAMPLNRELLVLGLRFAYIPTRTAMRLGKRMIKGWRKLYRRFR